MIIILSDFFNVKASEKLKLSGAAKSRDLVISLSKTTHEMSTDGCHWQL